MTIEETKVLLMKRMNECEDVRDCYLIAKALADLTRAEAEDKKAEAEMKKVDSEAWRCESNETIAQLQAKTEIIQSALDTSSKVACVAIAAGVTTVGYNLITEHEVTGCVTSAIKAIIPKMKFW